MRAIDVCEVHPVFKQGHDAIEPVGNPLSDDLTAGPHPLDARLCQFGQRGAGLKGNERPTASRRREVTSGMPTQGPTSTIVRAPVASAQ